MKRSIKMFSAVLAVVCMVALTPIFAFPQAASAASLGVSTNEVTLHAGTVTQVDATGLKAKYLKKVTWTSSDKNIVNLNVTRGPSVNVQAITEGTAKVTAKYGKRKQVIQVTVDPAQKEVVTEIKEIKLPLDRINTVTGTIRGESYTGGVIYQESAEVAAQYAQAFKLARMNLDNAIAANGGTGEGLAIVTDIDATLMDDSCYIAGALLDKEGRKAQNLPPWNNDDWAGYYAAVATTADQAVPGAVKFINYAYDQGVEIYYITNRPYYELDLTVQQLKEAGFEVDDIVEAYAPLNDKSTRLQEYHYWADSKLSDESDYNKEVLDYKKAVIDPSAFEMGEGYFSLAGDYRVQVQGSEFSSDKAERRANVAKKVAAEGGKVIMYMGDSLNDMISKKEYKYNSAYTADQALQFDRSVGNEARTAVVTTKKFFNKWGTQFIVMPNSAYGDWQKATWNKMSISEDVQTDKIRAQLARHSYLERLNENAKTWYTGPSPIGPDIQ